MEGFGQWQVREWAGGTTLNDAVIYLEHAWGTGKGAQVVRESLSVQVDVDNVV